MTYPGDPRNRADLKDWLERRAEYHARLGLPNPPLSAREYLMVQRLQSQRPAYALKAMD